MSKPLLHIGTNGHVVAFDPASGEERWRTKLDAGGFFSATSHADVCVLEHEGRVFAGCVGHLFCLDAHDGRQLWQSDLKGLGYNDVTLSIAGKSVQLTTTEHQPQ